MISRFHYAEENAILEKNIHNSLHLRVLFIVLPIKKKKKKKEEIWEREREDERERVIFTLWALSGREWFE